MHPFHGSLIELPQRPDRSIDDSQSESLTGELLQGVRGTHHFKATVRDLADPFVREY